jgi:hypothetical protein
MPDLKRLAKQQFCQPFLSNMNLLPFILRSIISTAYIAVGAFVLVCQPFQAVIFDVSFALACIAYGVFRGYRAFESYKTDAKEA